MKSFLHSFSLILFIFVFFKPDVMARPTVSFGYLTNTSQNKKYDILEIIFPNSFASSIEKTFDTNVARPLDVNELLNRKYKLPLKKNYEPFELPMLTEQIEADYFIYGNFDLLQKNQIKFIIHIYFKGSNEIFTFTNIGKMETVISRLIDNVTIIILDFMRDEHLFISGNLPPGSKIGILTNIKGDELNKLYGIFMKNGYSLMSIQGNELHNTIDFEDFHKLRFIRTTDNTYDTISDWRKIKFRHGTWTGKLYNQRVKLLKQWHTRYDRQYLSLKNKTLDKLQQSYNGNLDVLLIIGIYDRSFFDLFGKSCWVRAIDVKKKRLIWMQSSITSWAIISDPINTIAYKLVETMQKKMKARKKFVLTPGE